MLRKYQPSQPSYLERMRNRSAADKPQWSKSDLLALAKQLEAAVTSAAKS